MTQLTIRQSGGANILSIPKAVLKALNLHTGSHLELAIENNKLVLTPLKEPLNLKNLLEGSPKKNLNMNTEDLEWMQEKAIGKEK